MFKHEIISLTTWAEYFEYLQTLEAKVEEINQEFDRRSQAITRNFVEVAAKYRKIYLSENKDLSRVKKRELRQSAAIAYAVGSLAGVP